MGTYQLCMQSTDLCKKQAQCRGAGWPQRKLVSQVGAGLRGRPRGAVSPRRVAQPVVEILEESPPSRPPNQRCAATSQSGQRALGLGFLQASSGRRHNDQNGVFAQRPVCRSVSERILRTSIPACWRALDHAANVQRISQPSRTGGLVNEHHRLKQRCAVLDHRGAMAAIPDAAAALMAPIESGREAPAQMPAHGAAHGLRAGIGVHSSHAWSGSSA